MFAGFQIWERFIKFEDMRLRIFYITKRCFKVKKKEFSFSYSSYLDYQTLHHVFPKICLVH